MLGTVLQAKLMLLMSCSLLFWQKSYISLSLDSKLFTFSQSQAVETNAMARGLNTMMPRLAQRIRFSSIGCLRVALQQWQKQTVPGTVVSMERECRVKVFSQISTNSASSCERGAVFEASIQQPGSVTFLTHPINLLRKFITISITQYYNLIRINKRNQHSFFMIRQLFLIFLCFIAIKHYQYNLVIDYSKSA